MVIWFSTTKAELVTPDSSWQPAWGHYHKTRLLFWNECRGSIEDPGKVFANFPINCLQPFLIVRYDIKGQFTWCLSKWFWELFVRAHPFLSVGTLLIFTGWQSKVGKETISFSQRTSLLTWTKLEVEDKYGDLKCSTIPSGWLQDHWQPKGRQKFSMHKFESGPQSKQLGPIF